MTQPRISIHVRHDAPDAELRFARQLGADCVYTWVPLDATDVESLTAFRRRVEDHELTLYNAGCIALGKNDRIHLNLPGRADEIARFQEFITNLGEAGIGVTTFTWEPDGVWSSSPGISRDATARVVDLDELTARPNTHDREYGRDELWDNFEYFIERLEPTLRASGVRLALHPNDPPTDRSLGGIPCLIYSLESYERAFSFAPADVLGMELCCGCWLEGRDTLGDPAAAVERFVPEDRVLIVHFRNVSSPLPEFTETFLDNGYGDMSRITRALCREHYAGTVTPDHVPRLVAPYGDGASFAYAVGYIKALLQHPGN